MSSLRSQPVSEKARALFKAVAWRRQQETHSHSHKSSHQRARSRALKAVYTKGKRTILVEIPNIPKSKHTPPPFDKLKLKAETDRQAKQIKREYKTIKKTTQEAHTEPLQA
jgi:hypothetical protein